MHPRKLISLSIATSLFLGNVLYAQNTQTLENVTVTASKMEENIKDIPQSITVMSDIEIEQRGIKSIRDLIQYIPNLISSPMDSERINFRGINHSSFTSTNPIVIYIDGIPHSSNYGFDKTISNVLRVEVLRGPQGTIYGKDSMGGVINIVTKDPSNNLEGSILAEYGTDNYQQTAFDISSPLIDNKLFLGINGAYSQSDGYNTNHYSDSKKNENEKERYIFNTNLKYTPNDNLSIKLNIKNDKDDKYGLNEGIVPFGEDINSYDRDDFKNVSYDEDTYTKTKSNSQALHVDYNFNKITFSSLTTHSNTDTDVNVDFDLSDNPVNNNLSIFNERESKDISQEFRLSGDNDTLRWVAGVYYENSTLDINKQGGTFPAAMMMNPFGVGVNIEMKSVSKLENDTLAAFGQAIIPFLTDYELTLGGRYQRVKKDIKSDYYFLPIGTTGNPSNTLDGNHTWGVFLPRIALSYKINKDLTSYFSITKGYLAGGYNTFASGGTTDFNRFDAQKSTNYELGIRGDLLDNSLYLSGSIFYMDIEDLQVSGIDQSTNTAFTSNAAEAYSQGIELELGYNINDNWSINTSLGIIEAKYDKYIDSNGNDLKDKKIQLTPSHTANIWVSYFNDNGIYGRFDIKNQGKIYFNDTNTQKENSYTIANIKIGYLFDDWDIYTYVNNITDKSYLTAAADLFAGTTIAFGEGRFIGVGAKYSF